MIKKLLSFFLIFCVLISSAIGVYAYSEYNDHRALFGAVSDWAVWEISKAYEQKLVPDTFLEKDLNVPVSRGEFAAIAVTLFETLTNTEISYQNTPFTDVAGNANEVFVKKAYAVGITAGISENRFAPDEKISREQFATMLCRVFKKYVYPDWNLSNDREYPLPYAAAALFSDDGNISDYAKEAVYFLNLHSVVEGMDDHRFTGSNDADFATREQAILLSVRCLERLFTEEILEEARIYPTMSATNKIPYIRKFTLNSAEEVSELALYEEIEYLKIDSANISDFSFLKDLNISLLQVLFNEQYPLDFRCINAEAIEQLYLLNVDIVNTEAAANFQNLFCFLLKHGTNQPQVTNLDFLAECTKMREVEIQNYGITNLDFAKNMSRLHTLSVKNSSLEDMSGLSDCAALSSLTLSRGKLKDISVVSRLKKLSFLDLSDNYIENADTAYQAFTDRYLCYLNLSDNYITEVHLPSEYFGPSNDISLNLSRNYISKLPENILPNMYIELDGNNIREFSEEEKQILQSHEGAIDLYDNLLNEETMREIATNEAIHFGEFTLEEAIRFTNKIRDILSLIVDGTDYEKVYQIVNGVRYSFVMDYSLQAPYKDSAYGALFDKAVCTGSTDLTNVLCRHSGIRVKEYHGDLGDPNDFVRHDWTLVEIDGHFYHCDAMQNKGNPMPLPYLLSSDDKMKNHSFILDALNVFACDEPISRADRDALQQGHENWLQQNNMTQFNFNLIE
ncbi:MAG: hypothetical protein E7413_05175 [Ruminococcaceae bacterium]|nr:hypothetical protein [Oscillospiraceae bacterium]